MPTPQRRNLPAVIGRLLRQPQRFEFFQALRTVEQWLRLHHQQRTLEGMLRFRHSVSLSFPASDIAALDLADGRLHITPTFMGYLGISGVLPYCYTDTIAAQLHTNVSGRAFFDTFCHRSLTLFYRAWQQGRIEYRFDAHGRNAMLPMQLSLAGAALASDSRRLCGIDDEVIASYAALIRQRPASGAVIQQVLRAYFDVPFLIEPFAGAWENIPGAECSRLGHNTALGRSILGRRYWRRDLVRLWIGPLCRNDFDRFLPGGDCAGTLRNMLALFALPGTRFAVHPILRAQDLQRIALDHRTRLGCGATLIVHPAKKDHTRTHYDIVF